jgi:hypothetical protein
MESTYYHFTRMHAPRLLSLGVLRRPHPRAAYIADVTTFDEAVFDLLSHAGHKQGVQHV